MADDLSRKLEAAIEKLRQDVDRLMMANPLEAASVTSGRVRFIGGTLRVDAGGSVEIVGSLEVDGTTTVTGSFTVTGPWNLAGDGTISGNVTGTGTLTWTGPWNLNGTGKIQGPVDITGILRLLSDLRVESGGKITVTGADGDTVIANSRVTFANGAELVSETDSLVVRQGTSGVVAGSGQAQLRSGGKFFRVSSGGGFRMAGVPEATDATGLSYLAINSAGDVFAVPAP
ncbi:MULTISPECIES: hypothetical protein [unclassified Microbacterium]|uniref:hypothetical protein n=1 Tax=unclassified Microbacterium TaxID=2609290 RepID=UPI0030101C75